MHTRGALGALAMMALAACAQDRTITGLSANRAASPAANAVRLGADAPGAVYALTNQASGNAVAMYARAADGSLAWLGNVSTGGLGAGSRSNKELRHYRPPIALLTLTP